MPLDQCFDHIVASLPNTGNKSSIPELLQTTNKFTTKFKDIIHLRKRKSRKFRHADDRDVEIQTCMELLLSYGIFPSTQNVVKLGFGKSTIENFRKRNAKYICDCRLHYDNLVYGMHDLN